jgi:hypothetical protein
MVLEGIDVALEATVQKLIDKAILQDRTQQETANKKIIDELREEIAQLKPPSLETANEVAAAATTSAQMINTSSNADSFLNMSRGQPNDTNGASGPATVSTIQNNLKSANEGTSWGAANLLFKMVKPFNEHKDDVALWLRKLENGFATSGIQGHDKFKLARSLLDGSVAEIINSKLITNPAMNYQQLRDEIYELFKKVNYESSLVEKIAKAELKKGYTQEQFETYIVFISCLFE